MGQIYLDFLESFNYHDNYYLHICFCECFGSVLANTYFPRRPNVYLNTEDRVYIFKSSPLHLTSIQLWEQLWATNSNSNVFIFTQDYSA